MLEGSEVSQYGINMDATERFCWEEQHGSFVIIFCLGDIGYIKDVIIHLCASHFHLLHWLE